MSNKNMELWEKVCKTNPNLTKQVTQRGGFTAVCAQSQVKTATEIFGMYGKGWGLKSCKYEIIGNEIVFDAVFFAGESEFEISVDMIYKAGNDCRKKLRTDAQSKALSLLGFNSDIFEGKFDDNKYINELKEEFSLTPEEKKAREVKKEILEIKKQIGIVLVDLTKAGVNKAAIKNSIKKHLGVEELKDCNELEKLKEYYLKKSNDLINVKKEK